MKARVYITPVLSRAQLGRGHHTHMRGLCVSLLISTLEGSLPALMYLFQTAAGAATWLSFLKWMFHENSHAEREHGAFVRELNSVVLPSKALCWGKHKSWDYKMTTTLN